MEFLGSYILYFTILVLSVICAYRIEQSETEGEERGFRILLFLVLTVPAVLRYDIGTDYPHYVLIYDFIADVNVERVEWGYRFLCSLLNRIGANSFWMFFVMSILTYAPFCFGTPRSVMTGCTFMFVCAFYLNSYSLIRQAVAVSFLLYASFRLLEGRGKRFLVYVVIASLFHRSALLVLPFYFIRKQMEKPWAIACCCCAAFGVVLGANVIEVLFSNQLFLESSYGRYVDGDFAQETEIGTGLGVLSRMALPVLTLLFVRQLREEDAEEETERETDCINEDRVGLSERDEDTGVESEDKEDKLENTGYIFLVCIAYVVAMYLASKVYIFNRLNDLFRFVPILCMGLFFSKIYFRLKKTVLAGFILLYVLLFALDLVGSAKMVGFVGGLGVMPYQTIFDELF